MRIGLFGYGKMGKMLEKLAVERGHTIAVKVDLDTDNIDYTSMDIAIDFSTPDAAFQNITSCFQNKIPVISGTTGWLSKFNDAVASCSKHNSGFIYASNFSLGVNIFFELNKKLAKMMSGLNDYGVSLEEIHHTQKLDAPSGTAITLAQGVIENSNYTNWKMEDTKEHEVPIIAKRIGKTPGTHTVTYNSAVDTIEIKHIAHGRHGFALGAIIAAEWLVNKTGVYTMQDVLNLR